MTPTRWAARAAAVLSCSAITACLHSEAQPSRSAGAPVSADVAAGALATARCTHAMTCNEVGSGKRFSSEGICFEEVRDSLHHDLSSCAPLSVDPGNLAGCERRLRDESCAPLSTLSRMMACRPQTLCVAPSTPGDGPEFTGEDVYGSLEPAPRPSGAALTAFRASTR
jgi:hypothetical protein